MRILSPSEMLGFFSSFTGFHTYALPCRSRRSSGSFLQGSGHFPPPDGRSRPQRLASCSANTPTLFQWVRSGLGGLTCPQRETHRSRGREGGGRVRGPPGQSPGHLGVLFPFPHRACRLRPCPRPSASWVLPPSQLLTLPHVLYIFDLTIRRKEKKPLSRSSGISFSLLSHSVLISSRRRFITLL